MSSPRKQWIVVFLYTDVKQDKVDSRAPTQPLTRASSLPIRASAMDHGTLMGPSAVARSDD